MRKAIKIELWKAFHNPMLWLALAGAAFIVLANVWDCAAEMSNWTRVVQPFMGDPDVPASIFSTEGYSLFVLSLPYYSNLFSAQVFIYVWPILAAIPYGTSYMTDRRTGIYNQIVSRIGRKKYFIAKYSAVFVTGGLVVALTVLAALLMDAMIVPYWKVHISLIEVIHSGTFLSTLYYTHPWLHILCWCGVLFFIGGCTACLTFFAWTGLRLRALTAVIPFAIYFVIATVASRLISAGFIPYSDFVQKFSNVLFMVQVQSSAYPGFWALIMAGIITVITLIAGYFQVVRHELD